MLLPPLLSKNVHSSRTQQHLQSLQTLCIVLLQAFTTEFRVHWGQHLLRPEFAESTYYLYKVIVLNSFVVIIQLCATKCKS